MGPGVMWLAGIRSGTWGVVELVTVGNCWQLHWKSQVQYSDGTNRQFSKFWKKLGCHLVIAVVFFFVFLPLGKFRSF